MIQIHKNTASRLQKRSIGIQKGFLRTSKNTAVYRQYQKLDPLKVQSLKQQGLSNKIIAQRLGVTQGAVYHVLRKLNVKNYTGESPASSQIC